MLEKILISSCFLGEKVRYNGEIKALIHPLIVKWQSQGRLVSFCPEIAGGLTVPRDAAEIQVLTGDIITTNGVNVNVEFQLGAQKSLELCQSHNIKYALLKEFSPSCGSLSVYDGTFSGNKISGQGVTTQLLLKHGIEVFSEQTIKELDGMLE